ncbi:MAG: condensation domain-containing protein [Candidatus Aminicenantes bacterium]|jgi:NRPS condensation-like uncharacterized protein
MNRPLSTFEKALWLIDRASSQNFVIVARISGTLKESILRQALDIVQQRHPPLQCRIKTGDVPEFVTEDVPQIPLRVVKRKHEHHWVEEAEEESIRPLPWTTGPLVRMVLLQSGDKCDLLASFFHVIADGLSGINFFHNLLRVAGKLSSGNTPATESPLPELPSTLDLLKKDLQYKKDYTEPPHHVNYKPVELPADRDPSTGREISRLIPKILSTTTTKKIITRCKENKVSVHEALCAALMQTVVEHIRESLEVPEKGPLLIGCITPVNIRHRFKISIGEDIGNFISASYHYQLIDDNSSLWDAARVVKKSLAWELEYGKDVEALLNIKNFFKENSTPEDMARDMDKVVPPLTVTNMGRIDIPEKYGNLFLEEMHAVSSLYPRKNRFSIIVTTFRGQMTMDCHYSEPFLSKERARLIVKKIIKRLK